MLVLFMGCCFMMFKSCRNGQFATVLWVKNGCSAIFFPDNASKYGVYIFN